MGISHNKKREVVLQSSRQAQKPFYRLFLLHTVILQLRAGTPPLTGRYCGLLGSCYGKPAFRSAAVVFLNSIPGHLLKVAGDCFVKAGAVGETNG